MSFWPVSDRHISGLKGCYNLDNKNPSVTAIEAAKKGSPAKKAQDGKGPAAEPLEELGKGLQDLFKR